MYARPSETVVVPVSMSDQYAVVRRCQRGILFYTVELRPYGEAVYTPDDTAKGAKLIGRGYVPEENDGWPHGVMPIIQADLSAEDHHWHSLTLRDLVYGVQEEA